MEYGLVKTYNFLSSYLCNQKQNFRKEVLVGLVAIVTLFAAAGCQEVHSIRGRDGMISSSEQKLLEADEGINTVPIVGWRF